MEEYFTHHKRHEIEIVKNEEDGSISTFVSRKSLFSESRATLRNDNFTQGLRKAKEGIDNEDLDFKKVHHIKEVKKRGWF